MNKYGFLKKHLNRAGGVQKAQKNRTGFINDTIMGDMNERIIRVYNSSFFRGSSISIIQKINNFKIRVHLVFYRQWSNYNNHFRKKHQQRIYILYPKSNITSMGMFHTRLFSLRICVLHQNLTDL